MRLSFALLLFAALPLFAVTNPQVSLQSLRVAEGDSGTSVVEVPMTLSAPADALYTVRYEIRSWSAAGGLDFIETSGSVAFAPGETVQHVPVSILGDERWEEDELLIVRLADSWWTDATVTILNDDPVPVVAAENLRIPEGNAASAASVTIRAPYPVSGWVLVRLADGSARATSDFEGGAEYLYFDNERAKTFPFTILGDEEPEPSERFAVEVRSASAGLAAGRNGVVTLVNDDAGVGPAEQWVPAGGSRTFTVQLGEGLAEEVTIGLSSGDRSAVAVPATLVIPAGRQSADFDATALAPGANVDVGIVFPPGLGGGTRSVRVRTYVKATLRFDPARLNVVDGGTATVAVSLDPPSATATTLGVRASDRVDVPRSLTIPPGGSAPLLVTAGKLGTFTIDLRLPPVHGNELQSLYGEVIAEPQNPAVLGLMNVSPASGTSAGGTHVRVEGSAFDGSCWLFFGGLAAADVVVRDPQSITASAPAHAAGAADVTVRCSGGTATLPDAFTYRDGDDPAPLILEIVPPAAAPGELVTIRGLHFRLTDGVAVEAAPAALADSAPEQHVIAVPELPAGRASLFVRDVPGRSTTSGPLFSVLEARPPRIAAAAPARVAAGGELELTGEGFRPGYTFEIGGRPAAIVSREYTRAVVRVGAEVVAGAQAVQVRNSAGVLAAIGPDVEIVAGMIVTSVDPRCTTTDAGVYATIHGHGFSGNVAVSFAGVPSANVMVIDGTTLRVAVPPGAAGLARISVTDDVGRTATLTNGFRYVSPFDPQGCDRGSIRE